LQVVVFIFYLLLVSFIITIIPFFKKSGINKWTLIVLFVVKLLTGIAYGLFYTLPKYNTGSDTWRFYRLSISETKWLLSSPLSFAKDLFYHGYANAGNLFKGENTYWNDLKSNLFVKIMALFNVLSGSSYYVNIIFFNFLFLFGLVALAKLLFSIYADRKPHILFGIFLLPSTLFWCSGIHKDGLILSAIGVAIYCFWNLLNQKISIKYILLNLLSFLIIFSLRSYILFALIPALLCWFLSKRFGKQKALIFISVYLIGLIAFFAIPGFFPSINLPLFLSAKRQEFLQLQSGSLISDSVLSPTLSGFFSFLPEAIDMAFFRPHVTEMKSFFYVPAIIENLLLLVLITVCFLRRKTDMNITPALLCLIAFALSVLLICGYTVPFTGAIVRYRSLVLPLLVTPLLCIANFSFYTKNSKLRK